MKILSITILCALALLAIATPSLAQSRIAIIVNEQNKQNLTFQEITNIYQDKIITWESGEKIDVYNLPSSSEIREAFSQSILGLSARGAAAEESNRRMSNISRNPQMLKRERLVKLAVAANTNAIGYISADSLGSKKGIRVLFIIE